MARRRQRGAPEETVHIVSLGCAKNTVDSDSMAELLRRSGYRRVASPESASVLVVNTCGFIAPARQESYEVLRDLASRKAPGQLLIAAGCLTQRYGAEVALRVPEIDGLLGTRRWMDIVDTVRAARARRDSPAYCHLPLAARVGDDERGVLRASVRGGSAYLKIADGCRRSCAFCAIPAIKGPAVSRPADTVLAEAERLRDAGVHEIILIAQDTTDYGHDLGQADGLADLLERLVERVPEVEWIRIMYAYPSRITDRLIEVMAARRQVVPYLDLPLQHADPAVLRRMRRPARTDRVRRTVRRLRAAMPDIALRSTFIVGYPGETEEAFQVLLDFVAEMRLDRVGVFEYSREAGTAAEALGDPVPTAVKEERRERLMALQRLVSIERAQAMVHRALRVLVEGTNDGISVGRTYRDAPEVDGLAIVRENAPVGQMVTMRVTAALDYDLMGRLEPAASATGS